MEIVSPVTGKNNVNLEKTIKCHAIIEEYKMIKPCGIDVSRFFKDTKEVSIYTCLDTGYRFYYPYNLAGDDTFYQELEKNPWYYMDWKWEHDIAGKYIKNDDKILEIGCAHGSFLEKIKTKISVADGLEMNSQALEDCHKKKITAYNGSIEEYYKQKLNFYDIVCSFQVLEHITNIKTFIESSLSVLKPGGLLILSVPNNDCFFLKNKDFVTNMPPHHMGLWNLNSFIKLQNYFEFKVEAIHLEPLQKYHIGFAEKIANEKLKTKLKEKFGHFSPFFANFAGRLFRLGINAVSPYITGHTMLIVFKKN